MDNELQIGCFVPNCANVKLLNRQNKRRPLQFFPVPDGIEGLFWTKAVKTRQRNYEKLIDLLSSTDPTLGLDKSKNKKSKSQPKDREYCCEVHFDVSG